MEGSNVLYIVNFSEPLVVLMGLLIVVLFIILGKEFKKSILPAIPLFLFLILLVIHTVQIIIAQNATDEVKAILMSGIIYDSIYIFLSYISYLWVDDIETKAKNKKSIDNSLDWFWKEI